MSDNVRYWLWFQKAIGYCKAFKPIIEEFGSVKALYDANILDYKMSPSLSSRQVERLVSCDLSCADKIIDACNKNNWQIIDYDDELYPKRLKEISNPPAVLYVDGQMPDIDSYACIGIVGTRMASDYSSTVARIMGSGCADGGAVVISGGALGIDTYAHTGALAVGGKTVAVLGCGFGDNYLKANLTLRDNIRKNGALVTEYPPYTRATKGTFPQRNRIISGLSVGVLVVEASSRSGSLITASCAAEQGRDVFAVASSILSPSFAGTNRLIDDGAVVVTKPLTLIQTYENKFDTIDTYNVKSVEEYLKKLSGNDANAPRTAVPEFDCSDAARQIRNDREVKSSKLMGDLLTVYNCLGDVFVNIDYIVNNTQLTNSRVLSALTQLELMDLAVSVSGRRYKKS